MTLIHAALDSPPPLPVIPLPTDRLVLLKRRWRGTAADGTDFGFDLSRPLADGTPFFATGTAVYRVVQNAEPVLEITLIPRPAPVARLAWTIGNLHFPIQVTEEVIRVPDDPALRQLFGREGIPFTECERVFTPFAKSHAHDAI